MTGTAVAERLTNAVLDFRPSRHGLHFRNAFEPGLALRMLQPGATVMGLCGGMAYVVRDLFERRIEPPAGADVPRRGTRRYNALYRREVESFDWFRLPVRFWVWSALHPDQPTWWSRLLRRRPLPELTLRNEWPRIRSQIDAGKLAMVGLVRGAGFDPRKLTQNHQVLAYGYRVEPGLIAVRIYDPNFPDADDVEARILLPDGNGPPTVESRPQDTLRGFFSAKYRPAEPRAWRG
jgi:hypothetical protein